MILLVRDIDLNSVRSTVRVTGNHRDLQTFVLPRDFQPNKTLLDTIASRLAGIETVHFMKTLVRPFCAVLFVIVKIRDRMSRSERFQLKSISSSKCWFVHDDFQLRINTYTEDFIHVKDLLFFFKITGWQKLINLQFNLSIGLRLANFLVLHSSPEILIHRRG